MVGLSYPHITPTFFERISPPGVGLQWSSIIEWSSLRIHFLVFLLWSCDLVILSSGAWIFMIISYDQMYVLLYSHCHLISQFFIPGNIKNLTQTAASVLILHPTERERYCYWLVPVGMSIQQYYFEYTITPGTWYKLFIMCSQAFHEISNRCTANETRPFSSSKWTANF